MLNAKVIKRLDTARMNILLRYPFYGYLLMHIDFKETQKEKTYTDMDAIYFNANYISCLKDSELEFILLHEILHIAFMHPIHMEGHNAAIYAKAADIVVNSILMDSMGVHHLEIMNHPVVHTIRYMEGYELGTENVYEMLIKDMGKLSVNKFVLQNALDKYFGEPIDTHDNWDNDSSEDQENSDKDDESENQENSDKEDESQNQKNSDKEDESENQENSDKEDESENQENSDKDDESENQENSDKENDSNKQNDTNNKNDSDKQKESKNKDASKNKKNSNNSKKKEPSKQKISNMKKQYYEKVWKKKIEAALQYDKTYNKKASRGLQSGLLELVDNKDYISVTDWKKELHEFIQRTNDRFDYSFTPPDRRYAAGDFFLPAYNISEQIKVGNLWFCVDTSGSMDILEVAAMYKEIEACISQMNSLEGKLSFFDEEVTPPINFSSIEDIRSVAPVGGGGTDFSAIFRYMNENMRDNLPSAVVIMTDGYAYFPPEKYALGVPVLWAIIGGTDIKPPWGKCIYLTF